MTRTVDTTVFSPRTALLAGCAAAVADRENMALYEWCLAVPDIDNWPFDRARIELAYAEGLRRARSATAARKHLEVASAEFHRLQAQPWLSRARLELRAAGSLALVSPATCGLPLTAQEREVAELAATGLTNKQIASRVYLSPRTVGAHLYRAFPKLGISTRAGLRDALSGALP